MNGSIRLKDAITTTPTEPNVSLDQNDEAYISQIIQALEVAHNPRSTQDSRWQAYEFLEKTQSHGQAAQYGAFLALESSRPAVVRHYGISLLEKAVTFNPDSSTLGPAGRWLWELATGVREEDPAFVRNKIAKLWVGLAKVHWGKDWMDMDELLVTLWSKELVHKELVAVILDNLSEDVFKRDDATAGMRVTQLGPACIEIFTPAPRGEAAAQTSRSSKQILRAGQEGWLVRLADFLDWSMPDHVLVNERIRACALRVLAVLKSAMPWLSAKPIAAARCIERTAKGLTIPSYTVQLACVETILTLVGRPTPSDTFRDLFAPIYSAEYVGHLRQLHEWAAVDPMNIDDDKYVLARKLSELISIPSLTIDARFALLQTDDAVHDFLKLLLAVLSSQSLTVSTPALSSWVRILHSKRLRYSEVVLSYIGSVLDICSPRLMKFELLPEDSDDPIILFLNEDFDSMPDRHAFLGNYRRYCATVVETVVVRKLNEALTYILGRVDQALQTLSQDRPRLDVATYKRNSLSFLMVDTQLSFVEAALKGYTRWETGHGSDPQEDEQQRSIMEDVLESWGNRLLQMEFEDPSIRKRILQVAVTLATSALQTKENFVLGLLKYIFAMQFVDFPEHPVYSDVLKDFQNTCTVQLHQLATLLPNFLMTFYDELECRINEMINTQHLEDRQKISFQTFLFIIIHRCTTIEDDTRVSRLLPVVESIRASWQEPTIDKGLESFPGFCELVGVSKALDYLRSRQAQDVKDWSSYILDEEGRVIQTEMARSFQCLPLRATKSFLGASVDRVERGSAEYELSTSLWQSTIPVILPRMLKLLGFSHTFYSTDKWTDGSPEVRTIASRALNDRFWQAGISSGTREEFYAKVSDTRATMEGFASTMRAAIRNVREACYSVLYCMSKLEQQFYSYDDLPEPLARALFEDAGALSCHQFSTLVTVTRYIVDGCPKDRRTAFLTPVLSGLLVQLDRRITDEWDKISRQIQNNAGDEEDLNEEMKDESILRQLSYSGVMMVAGLLDPSRQVEHGKPSGEAERMEDYIDVKTRAPHQIGNPKGSMREFVLSTVDVLRPLMSFATHAIQIPDTRCCIIMVRVLKTIARDFLGESGLSAATREYMCSEILKAAITAFHDPHFVDMQKDLIALVVVIYLMYNPLTTTAKTHLRALPGVTEPRLAEAHKRMMAATTMREARGFMMNLLEGVRGVSISEQGKVVMPQLPGALGPHSPHRGGGGGKRRHRRAAKSVGSAVDGWGDSAEMRSLQAEYMMMSVDDDDNNGGAGHDRGTGAAAAAAAAADETQRKSPDLTGMADLFG